MFFVQCNPPIPVEVTTKGPAYCVAWIDYGTEYDCLWKCIIDSTGEVWDVPQPQIRGVKNISMGRTYQPKDVGTMPKARDWQGDLRW